MQEIENMEVTDGTDAGDGLVVDHEGLAETAEAQPEAEALAEATGAPVVEEGAPEVTTLCETEDATNCIWDAQNQGNGEGQSFIDIDGTAVYYDYTDVYANDGFIVDCDAMLTTHWFEQVVMGFKVEEDGSITMIDLGYTPEHYEEVLPTTHDEYMGRCWVPPIEEPEVPELVEVPEVSIATPVTVDPAPELAATGGVDMLTPLLVGSALLLTGAALVIRKKFKRA